MFYVINKFQIIILPVVKTAVGDVLQVFVLKIKMERILCENIPIFSMIQLQKNNTWRE